MTFVQGEIVLLGGGDDVPGHNPWGMYTYEKDIRSGGGFVLLYALERMTLHKNPHF